VAAILDRIAADIDELARARRVGDLAAAAVPASARRPRPAPLQHGHRRFSALISTIPLVWAW
jgi:hypothetical protein